jgi:hypothetical protein
MDASKYQSARGVAGLLHALTRRVGGSDDPHTFMLRPKSDRRVNVVKMTPDKERRGVHRR